MTSFSKISSVFCVKGSDSQSFLNNQLTTNITQMQNYQNQISAWCNRQGRVLATFWLQKNDDNHFLIAVDQSLESVMDELKKYIVISDVVIEKTDETFLDWDHFWQKCVEQKIPWITVKTSGLFLPQWIELDKVGGLDFHKGCYTGQEVVARLYFKGTNKYTLTVITNEQKIDFGAPLLQDGKKIGYCVVQHNHQILACVYKDLDFPIRID